MNVPLFVGIGDTRRPLTESSQPRKMDATKKYLTTKLNVQSWCWSTLAKNYIFSLNFLKSYFVHFT